MKPKKKKNISRVVADVRKPKEESSREKRKALFGWDQLGIGILIIFFLFLLALAVGNFWQSIKGFDIRLSDFWGEEEIEYGAIGGQRIEGLDNQFDYIEGEIDRLSFSESLSEVPAVFTKLSELARTVSVLDIILKEIDENAIELAFSGKGSDLIEILESGRDKILEFEAKKTELADTLTRLEQTESTLSIDTDMVSTASSIDQLISYINSEEPRETLVLFSDGPGFSSRYSLITTRKGNIDSFSVKESDKLAEYDRAGFSIDTLPANHSDSLRGVLVVNKEIGRDLESSYLLKLIIRELFTGNIEFYSNG